MRAVETVWIDMGLRKLLNYSEQRGNFLAWIRDSYVYMEFDIKVIS